MRPPGYSSIWIQYITLRKFVNMLFLSICFTQIVNEDETRVSMINTIFLPPIGTFIFDGVLTRSKNSEVQVNCSIPTRRVGYVEFETNSSTVVTKKDEVGDFGYSLKLFPDEDYRRPYRYRLSKCLALPLKIKPTSSQRFGIDFV